MRIRRGFMRCSSAGQAALPRRRRRSCWASRRAIRRDLLRKQSDARLAGDRWVLSSSVDAAGRDALARLEEYHAIHPGAAGMPLETLRRALRVPEAIALAAIDDLQSARLVGVSGGVASLPEFRVVVKGGDAEVERIVRLLDEAGLSPPTVPQLASQAGSGDLADGAAPRGGAGTGEGCRARPLLFGEGAGSILRRARGAGTRRRDHPGAGSRSPGCHPEVPDSAARVGRSARNYRPGARRPKAGEVREANRESAVGWQGRCSWHAPGRGGAAH